MLSLPVEICYDFSRYLNHRDYTRLRQTCKFLSRLDLIQYLYFQSYVESVDLIGNHPKLPSQIRLDNQCLNDDSFLYIAVNGHSGEFLRLFHTKAIDKISVKAKEKAFVAIIYNDGSQEMICELLTDGFVDATLPVTYQYYTSRCKGTALHELLTDGFVDATLPVTYQYYTSRCKGTALHWACMNGYFDLVLLLLTYFNVEVCSKDTKCKEPIHYAAQYGHTESYSF
jgi:hypothetical protein